jgi:hypothetical protein
VNGSVHLFFVFSFHLDKSTSRHMALMNYGSRVFQPHLLVYGTCALFGVLLVLVDTSCELKTMYYI